MYDQNIKFLLVFLFPEVVFENQYYEHNVKLVTQSRYASTTVVESGKLVRIDTILVCMLLLPELAKVSFYLFSNLTSNRYSIPA